MQVHLKGNHFRLLARLLKEGWERLEGFITEGLDVIRVHVSCAVVINGGYLAAVKGLGSRTTLAVATESDVRRRSLLKQQYPTALIAADARSALACAVDVHVLIVTWPCQPYSSSHRIIYTVAHQRRCQHNTALLVETLLRVCSSIHPPLLVLIENVPGFVEREASAECCVWLAPEMRELLYQWHEEIICPATHMRGPQMRKRFYCVGTLQALTTDLEYT